MKRAEISESYEPFKSNNVRVIKRGDFKNNKIKSLVMEVNGVEAVGNCY
jgi:hypothetical protein